MRVLSIRCGKCKKELLGTEFFSVLVFKHNKKPRIREKLSYETYCKKCLKKKGDTNG